MRGLFPSLANLLAVFAVHVSDLDALLLSAAGSGSIGYFGDPSPPSKRAHNLAQQGGQACSKQIHPLGILDAGPRLRKQTASCMVQAGGLWWEGTAHPLQKISCCSS